MRQPESPLEQRSWYCIQTKVGAEDLAKRNLERQGYEVYLPLAPSDQRKKTKKQFIPLFPSYAFLHLSIVDDDWSPIRSTIGVRKLIRYGEFPAVAPDEVIADLQKRENGAGIHDYLTHEYQKGDEIEFEHHYLQYIKAIFQAQKGKDRVYILMDILGQQAEVEVLRKKIRPAA